MRAGSVVGYLGIQRAGMRLPVISSSRYCSRWYHDQCGVACSLCQACWCRDWPTSQAPRWCSVLPQVGLCLSFEVVLHLWFAGAVGNCFVEGLAEVAARSAIHDMLSCMLSYLLPPCTCMIPRSSSRFAGPGDISQSYDRSHNNVVCLWSGCPNRLLVSLI